MTWLRVLSFSARGLASDWRFLQESRARAAPPLRVSGGTPVRLCGHSDALFLGPSSRRLGNGEYDARRNACDAPRSPAAGLVRAGCCGHNNVRLGRRTGRDDDDAGGLEPDDDAVAGAEQLESAGVELSGRRRRRLEQQQQRGQQPGLAVVQFAAMVRRDDYNDEQRLVGFDDDYDSGMDTFVVLYDRGVDSEHDDAGVVLERAGVEQQLVDRELVGLDDDPGLFLDERMAVRLYMYVLSLHRVVGGSCCRLSSSGALFAIKKVASRVSTRSLVRTAPGSKFERMAAGRRRLGHTTMFGPTGERLSEETPEGSLTSAEFHLRSRHSDILGLLRCGKL